MPRLRSSPARFVLPFSDPAAWRRSQRGNLWRYWDGTTLTIFERDDGRFAWCIAGEDGPTFSRRTFKSESAAMRDLAEAMGEDE